MLAQTLRHYCWFMVQSLQTLPCYVLLPEFHWFDVKNNILKNSLAVKKVQPCSTWPVGKELWNRRGQPRNGCDGIGWWQKNLITTIRVNLCCQESAQNSPELLLLNFCHQLIPSQPFLGSPFDFAAFFLTGHFEQGRIFFCFLSVYHFFL